MQYEICNSGIALEPLILHEDMMSIPVIVYGRLLSLRSVSVLSAGASWHPAITFERSFSLDLIERQDRCVSEFACSEE